MAPSSTGVALEKFSTTSELVSATASALIAEVIAAGQRNQRFSLGLSGGRVARSLYEEVVRRSASTAVPWHVVDFFWADERCVPPDHAESNFRQADESFLRPLNIPKHHVFRLRGELPPNEAANLASGQLRENIVVGQGGLPALDLVFLGMGEDGHVASLFPGAPAEVVEAKEPFLAIFDSPKPPPERITMSYALLAAAKQVWVIVASGDKTQMLKSSLSLEGTSSLARLIRLRKETRILTDQAV